MPLWDEKLIASIGLRPTRPHWQADAARAATISISQQRPGDFEATSLTNIHN